MELIKEFRNSDFGYDNIENIDYSVRRAARCVVVRDDGKLAILHAKNIGIHKIPGGGLDEGEDIIDGLKRELMEESGSVVEEFEELGMTIEYRDDIKKKLISYCFYGKEIDNVGIPSFTEKEIKQGFYLEWLSLDDAIKLSEKDKPTDYHAEFMGARDLFLLKKYAQRVSSLAHRIMNNSSVKK
ncbi:ADP-ribose pyrophosphatase [Candidatus Woesearchaeota archaeon]|nr:MAG: ADP-ribose pyrophosphatase [Candidatus Woesearchaeota archaeon]